MKKFEFKSRSTGMSVRKFDLEKTTVLFLEDKQLQRRSEKTIKTYRGVVL